MTKKKKATAAATGVVALALLFAGSFAWISTLQTASNEFVQEDYDVKLHDVFDGKEVANGESHQVKWTAGNTVDKNIWVSNEGSDDVLVRVKLTENMTIKENNGAETTIGNADAAHILTGTTPDFGTNCTAIHDNVTWDIGNTESTKNVISYDEWQARDGESAGQEKSGAFWVIAPDGWTYWMQPLQPADPSSSADPNDPSATAGNTELLLTAVTLNEGKTGRINYSIKAEMDAIDANLDGFFESGEGGNNWAIGTNARDLLVYSSGKIAAIQEKKDATASIGAKKLYETALTKLKVNHGIGESLQIEKTADETAEYYEKHENDLKQEVNLDTGADAIPDTALRTYIKENYATDDGKITKDSLLGLYGLDLNDRTDITSLEGITVDKFPNIRTISCNRTNIGLNQIYNLQPEVKANLIHLSLAGNSAVSGSFNGTGFTNLERLYFNDSKRITGVENLPSSLQVLAVNGSGISGTLDLSGLSNLEVLVAENTEIAEILGTGDMTKLEYVIVKSTKITSLDLSKSDQLACLNAISTPLTEIKFTKNTVTNPVAYNNGKAVNNSTMSAFIRVKDCKELASINISNFEAIKSIDITGCTKLLENIEQNVIKRDNQKVTYPQS